MSSRTDGLTVLNSFITGWSRGDEQQLKEAFHASATLRSSAHGEINGNDKIAELLGADHHAAKTFRLVTSNEYVAGTADHLVLTSYLFGRCEDEDGTLAALFGATLVGDLSRNESGWRFDDVRLSIPWTDGDATRLPGWNLPTEQGWQLGDTTPTIVSEEDSPWARGIPPLSTNTVAQHVADAYYRYAWAIDQGDIQLLRGSYTSDAHGEFPPMGHCEGRRDIIGQQKEFRRHWPWMQHFGRPLTIEVADNQCEARMIIGRVVPQRTHTEDGRNLYGAHYLLFLRIDQGQWRISYFDYRPGWIPADT